MIGELGPLIVPAPASLPPSGSAGGDLGGTYPNPTVVSIAHVTDTHTANTVYAGPTSGGVMAPTFRALVAADIPTVLNPISVGGALTAGVTLQVPIAPTATVAYGLVSIGGGTWAGGAAPDFQGNSNGTHIAVNTAAGYPGRMLDLQIAGVRMAAIGKGTVSSTGGTPVLQSIEFPSYTTTITGNTHITTAGGFNYVYFGAPTYSAGSALTVDYSATVAIAGPPVGGGAGPATLTNAYPFWVLSGTSRFDGAAYLTSTLLFGSGATVDNTVQRIGAGSLQFGAANNASPVSYVLTGGESARGSTDTNTPGGSLAIRSGLGTGTGAVTNIVFQTPTVGSSGTTAQVYATRFIIASTGIQLGAGATVVDTGAGVWIWSIGGAQRAAIGAGGLVLRGTNTGSGLLIGWTDGVGLITGVVDTYIGRATAAATIQIGNRANATPISNTLIIGESARPGTDSDVGGGSATLYTGQGTGIGANAAFTINAYYQVASGSGAKTAFTGLTVQGVGAAPGIGFLNHAAVVAQTVAAITNNIVASGTTSQLDDFTSLTVYATDAQAIHNDLYQLGLGLGQVITALRNYGLGI